MTLFSQMLSDYIRQNNVSVYALAQYCGLDRSTLYKFIRGARNPSTKEVIEQLAEFIHLTPTEKEQFLEAWKATIVGEENYYRRCAVEHFLSNIGMLDQKSSLTWQPECVEREPVEVVSGAMPVRDEILSMLLEEAKRENGAIDLLIPPTVEVIEILRNIETEALRVRHIFSLENVQNRNPKEHYNLECLERILPFYTCEFRYDAFYYYNGGLDQKKNFHAMPYLVLTSRCALLVSESMDRGIRIASSEELELLRNLYEEYASETRLLAQKADSAITQLEYFKNALLRAGKRINSFQMKPCLLRYITPELLQKYLLPELQESQDFMQMLEAHMTLLNERYAKLQANFIFSEAGVRAFMESGRIPECPPEWYKPIELEDRKRLLRNLLMELPKNESQKMLKKPMGDPRIEFSAFMSEASGSLMFMPPGSETVVIIDVLESSIVYALNDYMENLDEEMYYEGEEMRGIIGELIGKNEG